MWLGKNIGLHEKNKNGIMKSSEDEFKVLLLVSALYVIRFLVEICFN